MGYTHDFHHRYEEGLIISGEHFDICVLNSLIILAPVRSQSERDKPITSECNGIMETVRKCVN